MKPISRSCDGRVVGHRHLRAVLARAAQQLVDRLHALEQLGAQRRVEGVVLAGRPGEVPGVHEHVGRVEPVDRDVERHGCRCAGGVNSRLGVAGSSRSACTASAWACQAPTGSSSTDGPVGEPDAAAALEEAREPLDEVAHHVAGRPRRHRGGRVPVLDAVDGQLGEPAGDGSVPRRRVLRDAGHSSPASSIRSSSA